MEKFNFNLFPELSTERLILRQPTPRDSKAIYLLRSNKKINELISRKMPQSISETTKFIAELNKRFKDKKNIFWVIVSKEHNQVIGTIGYQNFKNNFSYAMGLFTMLCIPKIPLCGGFIIGVDNMEPKTPPLVMVKYFLSYFF